MNISKSLALITGHPVAQDMQLVVSASRQLALRDRSDVLREIHHRRVDLALFQYGGEIRRQVGTGKAIIMPFNSKKKGLRQFPQMVGEHTKRFELLDAARSRVQMFTVRAVAMPRDDRPLMERLEKSAATGNELLQQILTQLGGFYHRETGTTRRVLIWGPANKQGAGFGYKVLAGAEHVLDPEEVELERVSYLLQPLPDEEVSLPSQYSDWPYRRLLMSLGVDDRGWRSRFSRKYFHALFNVVLKDPSQLKALLDLPVDVTVQFENVEDNRFGFYARAQVIVGSNTREELDQFERALHLLCQKSVRVEQWDPFSAGLAEALVRSSVGSPAEIAAPTFSVPQWDSFLGILGSCPDAEEMGASGDVAVGRKISANSVAQDTLTINTVDESQVVAFIGVPKSGKTFKTLEMMMQRCGSRWVFFHCSSMVDEYAGKLALALGGTYKRRELPEIKGMGEYKVQVALIEKEIDELIKRFDALWELSGKPVKFPFVIFLKGPESLCTYYRLYLHRKLLALITKYYEAKGWDFGWVVDDAGSLPDPRGEDEHLGRIPATVGNAYRHLIRVMIQTYRKLGGFLAITVQSEDAFLDFSKDTFKSIPLAILFAPTKNHNVAAMLRPEDYAKNKTKWSLEKLAKAMRNGRRVKLPIGVLEVFNPFIDPQVRTLMGVK